MSLRKKLITLAIISLLGTSYAEQVLYLSTEIDLPFSTNLIEKINKTPINEDITLNISSPGGLISERDSIIDALAKHKGHVTCIVNDLAASAAASILMSCDKQIVNNNAIILFHIYQICTEGSDVHCTKYSPIMPSLRHPSYYFMYKQAMKEFNQYKWLFTDKEFEALSNGYNVTLSGWDVQNRIDAHNKSLQIDTQ